MGGRVFKIFVSSVLSILFESQRGSSLALKGLDNEYCSQEQELKVPALGQEEEKGTGYTGLCGFDALHHEKKQGQGTCTTDSVLGNKMADGCCHLPMDVIKKVSTMSPHANKKETQAFLGLMGFQRKQTPGYICLVSPFYQVI